MTDLAVRNLRLEMPMRPKVSIVVPNGVGGDM